MYSLVNTTISLSFKGKNAERQVLSDVVSAMDWQTIGDSVRSYRYQYNRLIRVTNHAADTPAYKDAMYYVDGADLDTERTYDANGNMTSNADSRISRISYDALNMPCRIDYIDGSHIDYTYAADGVKQRIDYYLNPYTSSLPDDDLGTACDSSLLVHTWREYAGNCVYVCDTLSMILINGGYITFDYTTHQPIYHYYLKDYLGNNRITVSLADGRIEEVNHYYPFGGLMGDSRNTGLQPYKYIGKELDRTHGLDWYDHGARHYDPVTGRWNVMDALAEKYYPWSPYVSCGDDPVDAVDIDGDSIFYFKPIIKQREVIGYIPFYCKETNNQYKFYSKNGKCYTGKNVFMGQVLKALKLLSLTPTGKKLINTLLGRKNIIIKYGENETTGNVVSWNNAIEIGGINENGNITRPTYIALGHELAHAVDQLYKKTEYGIWTKGPNSEDIPNTEKYATYIENEIRAEAKLPLRTHYAIIGNKGYEPTRIIDKKTKKNLFYGN